jgi:hypothetical protein
MGLMNVNH